MSRLNDEFADAVEALFASREKTPPTPAEQFADAFGEFLASRPSTEAAPPADDSTAPSTNESAAILDGLADLINKENTP